ncbi:MAG TPA: carboxypeptidase-like regulatory domain-containing protein [Tepidisphaeraceae bacterium]
MNQRQVVPLLFSLLLMLFVGHTGAQTSQPEVKPGEIAGTVTDESGQPISGATIDAWSWYTGNETKTDKEGKFHLKKLGRDGPVELRISKQGFCPWYNVSQETGVAELNVTLNNKTYFEGVVKDAKGNPVPNAPVRAICGPKQNPGVHITDVTIETRTDKDGNYKLYVWPDTYQVRVNVPKAGVARTQPETINDGETKKLDLYLDEGAIFKALCVDAETGEPIPNVELYVWREKSIKGKSDKAGKIEIPNTMEGTFEFNVKAKGYTRWWSDQANKPFQRKDNSGNFQRNFDDLEFTITRDMEPVKVELEKCVTITGVVQDPDGNPVAGATAAPALTGTGNSLTGDTRFSVTTKKDGTFVMELPSSSGRKYNLVAHDGKYQQWRKWANGVAEPIETTPGQKIDNVVLKLTKGATVKGKVVDSGGSPVAGRRVRASAADKLENRYYDPETRSDKDGNFELKFIRPGDHYIQCSPFWLNASQAPGGSVEVTLAEGETKEAIGLIAQPEH